MLQVDGLSAREVGYGAMFIGGVQDSGTSNAISVGGGGWMAEEGLYF